MRSLLLAATLAFCSEAWCQAVEPTPAQQAEIAKFRARLANDVARFRGRYPPSAREQGLEGTVIIAVVVGADGKTNCVVKKSSGHDILDERALAVVRYAASNVPMPEGLRGVAFSTDVRLRFALKPPAKRPAELKA